MARANFVKKARKTIYVFGQRVEYQGKKGSKREGRTMIKTDHTIPSGKDDRVLIEKGESYWWWQFLRGPMLYSKTKPRRSQLTQSEFLGWLYDMEDTIGAYTVSEEELEGYSVSDLEAVRDEWVGEIESQKDELQSKLDNMPESLQESSVLNERIEALETWGSDFENVEIEWADDDLNQEAEAEWTQLHTQALRDDDPTVDEEKETLINTIFLRMKREKIEELLGELQNISCEVG